MELSYDLNYRMILRLKELDLAVAKSAELLTSLDREMLRSVHRQARISTIA